MFVVNGKSHCCNDTFTEVWLVYIAASKQEAQLSLTNRATLFCKVVELLQDFVSENVDKKFTTDYNVA